MALTMNDFLAVEAIQPALVSTDKVAVIKELSEWVKNVYPFVDEQKVATAITAREKLGSTGIGHGVAIPHCKMPGLDNLLCVFGLSKKGVNFDSMDDQPAHIFFLLIAPENAAGIHLQALSLISRLCQNESFRENVLTCETAEEIFELIQKHQ